MLMICCSFVDDTGSSLFISGNHAVLETDMTITEKSAPVAVKPTTPASTKDTGKVHVGGAAIRFASVKDIGKVHVGGAAIRF